MEFTMPTPLQQEHVALDDEIALPPLGLLGALSCGEIKAAMSGVLAQTDHPEADFSVPGGYPAKRMQGRRADHRLST